MIGKEKKVITCSKAKHSNVEAVVFCSKCDKFYCEDCEEVHNDLLGDHIPFLQKVSSGNFFTEKCQEHPKYPLDVFCQTHWAKGENAVCCIRCKENSHSGCTTKNIDEVNLSRLKRDLTDDINKLKEDFAIISSLEESIAHKQEDFDKIISSIREDISKVFDTIRETISRQEEKILGNLEAFSEQYSVLTLAYKPDELSLIEDVLKDAEEMWTGWDETNPFVMIQKASLAKSSLASSNEKVSVIKMGIEKINQSLPTIKFCYDKSLIDKLKSFGVITLLDPPTNVKIDETGGGIMLSWDPVVIGDFDGNVKYQVEVKRAGDASPYAKIYDGEETKVLLDGMEPRKKYLCRVRVYVYEDSFGDWSKDVEVESLEYSFVWKECPNTRFCDASHKIVERVDSGFTTIIGTKTIPQKSLTSWSAIVLKTLENDNGVMFGVAPIDIDTSVGVDNSENCGWYFSAYGRNLYSGPPQNKRSGSYSACDKIRAGDVVTVTIDTRGSKGILSFAVNGKDLGVAFNDIPLDSLLVPALFIYKNEERVELIEDGALQIPQRVKKAFSASRDTKFGFVWKECPKFSRNSVKYTLSNSRRYAKKDDVDSDIYCTIIGKNNIPMRSTVWWKISCTGIFDKGGEEFFVGVAPAEIDQRATRNQHSCGWYLCWGSGSLYSGPPHNYNNKSYCESRRVTKASVVGLIMNTNGGSGTLSFMFDDLDNGVAYNGIPLDKPIVPCVLLHYAGDSIEIV